MHSRLKTMQTILSSSLCLMITSRSLPIKGSPKLFSRKSGKKCKSISIYFLKMNFGLLHLILFITKNHAHLSLASPIKCLKFSPDGLLFASFGEVIVYFQILVNIYCNVYLKKKLE